MSKTFTLILWALSVGMIVLAVYIKINSVPATKYDAATVRNRQEALVSLVSPVGGSLEVGQTQNVRWTAKNYSRDTVTVTLIRKVASNPDRYAEVRFISKGTKNDGDATWVPTMSDVGKDLFVQVGCTLSANACRASAPTTKLAVTNSGRFLNTANAFQAIEAANNK